MVPANLSRHGALRPPHGGSLLGADQTLRVGDDLLDSGTNDTGLLAQVPADAADLTLKPPTVLTERALDQAAPLANLALEPGPGAPNLAFEPVAGSGAATLVALDLALDGRASAVLAEEATDACD